MIIFAVISYSADLKHGDPSMAFIRAIADSAYEG